jgi:hypothetical protein
VRRARSFLGGVEDALDAAGKYLGRVGTLSKLAQYAPVVLGLLVVFFSPSAWLSGTLRRWSLGGVAVGAVAGGAALARFGVRSAHKQGLAFVLLVTLLVSAALLRLHLAIADVPFVERWRVLQPIHDLYLGSDAGELAYDALAGFGFAVVVASATLGLPVYLAWLRERRKARADAAEDEDARLRTALAQLTLGIGRLQERTGALRDENAQLRDELAATRTELNAAKDELGTARDEAARRRREEGVG